MLLHIGPVFQSNIANLCAVGDEDVRVFLECFVAQLHGTHGGPHARLEVAAEVFASQSHCHVAQTLQSAPADRKQLGLSVEDHFTQNLADHLLHGMPFRL